ncbi:molecular chaperone, partial [Leclercia adecarboxylata]|uniref:fimbrial biogenesis chaperone n=1 Tax=Leclercia adecarboxylata TaxID=83655 RepID=UPI00236E0C3C|nr:molecular chaperone [Leclercia adecarboxylata]
VKLFHRPAGLPGNARDAAAALVWTGAGNALQVTNPTAYHVTLSTLTLADGRKVEVDMIAPGQQVRYALPAGAPTPATGTFQWLDDSGTPRDQQATVSIP